MNVAMLLELLKLFHSSGFDTGFDTARENPTMPAAEASALALSALEKMVSVTENADGTFDVEIRNTRTGEALHIGRKGACA